MNTVWKFSKMEWDSSRTLRISIPANAKIIHVGVQYGVITLWVWLDPNAEFVDRTFEVIGTGWDAPDYATSRHRGTVMDGSFVWHVFEHLF